MVKVGRVLPTHVCPDCGTSLDKAFSVPGLCPHCLLELALDVTLSATDKKALLRVPSQACHRGKKWAPQAATRHQGREPLSLKKGRTLSSFPDSLLILSLHL